MPPGSLRRGWRLRFLSLNTLLSRPIWQRRLQALRLLSQGHRRVEVAERLVQLFGNEGMDRTLSVRTLQVDLAPIRRRLWEAKLKKLLRGKRLVAYQLDLRDVAAEWANEVHDRGEPHSERQEAVQATIEAGKRAEWWAQRIGLPSPNLAREASGVRDEGYGERTAQVTPQPDFTAPYSPGVVSEEGNGMGDRGRRPRRRPRAARRAIRKLNDVIR